jgi:hypothetical protein
MLKKLKIELRHKQLYKNNDTTQPIIVSCNPDGSASYIAGIVSEPNFIDFTDDVENLEEFDASWQASTITYSEGGNGNSSNEFGSNYSKGVTLDMRFTGAAFRFIFDWLMTDECQTLNSIDVRITDLDCAKEYRLFEIKLENTKYAPQTEPCIVSMALREKDDVWHAFSKTTIEDNWQNWFNQDGTATKQHPSFIYIVEKKPKFFLVICVVLAYVAGILSGGILTALTAGKEWVRKLLGICYFCPSPLIRTYIENICSKYGYTFDTIFDDKPGNPYRNVCLFYPVERSVQEFDDYTSNQTTFIWDNRTGLPFSKFLDQLKDVFNSEWYCTPNKQLVFKPRAFFDAQIPIIDLTTGVFQIANLVYTFSGKKKPAYGSYNYKLDPGDLCTNEIKWRYNAIVDFDGPANNPMLEGNVTKNFDFAMTAFNRDGTVEPLLESAINTGRIIALVAVAVGLTDMLAGTGGLTVAIAVAIAWLGYNATNGFISDFKDVPDLEGAVRLSNNNCNEPRLLLWDDTTPLNQAKVVKVVSPVVNPTYNPTAVTYYADHPTHDTPGLFGGAITNVYNFPMYIDEDFKDNLYDRFHEFDNPLRDLKINQEWEGDVQLCCDGLNAFGVWENDFAKIGATVILENRNGRLIKGRIDHIQPKYKDGLINLKGRVIK